MYFPVAGELSRGRVRLTPFAFPESVGLDGHVLLMAESKTPEPRACRHILLVGFS
jgi:hypothetical protein